MTLERVNYPRLRVSCLGLLLCGCSPQSAPGEDAGADIRDAGSDGRAGGTGGEAPGSGRDAGVDAAVGARDAGAPDAAANADAEVDAAADAGPAVPVSQQSVPTVTYDLARENRDGHDGHIAWQSVFLLNDGRIASFGTGNHAPNQSNAMRILDPVSSPGSLLYSEAFPWTQDITPPNMETGENRYVTNYDNHASIYVPSENKVVWVGHGVFDFDVNGWTYGDAPPSTREWTEFVADPRGGMEGVYNPATAWCDALDAGIWFGVSGGGSGRLATELTVFERNPGASPVWRLVVEDLADQGVEDLHNARNIAACVGSRVYFGGPANSGGNRFYEFDLATRTRTATLAPAPEIAGEYYPQLVFDARRKRFVLIGVKVLIYERAADAWSDVTPPDWKGYESVAGVYHPMLDAVFFRGMPKPALGMGNSAPGFEWHRMVFSD